MDISLYSLFYKNKMLIEKNQINTNSITATFNTGGNYISINMTGVWRACGDAEVGRLVLLSARRSPNVIVSKLHLPLSW